MGLAQILRQEGRQEGEATMLLGLLEQRFGSVSESFRARILAADSQTLRMWSERLFSAESIEAIFQ